MFKYHNGFTLTEFLFGMALFACACGLLIPDVGCTGFIQAREKGRETEVKSNIHSIQIGLERFAIDNGGLYPLILYGGDASDTFATSDSPRPPYDADYEYWPGDVDVLLEEGYFGQYPQNPFTRGSRGGRIITNPGENGFAPLEQNPGRVNIWVTPHDRAKEYIRREVGGRDGDLMWEVSEGQRHPPWPIVVIPDPAPSPTGFINPIPTQPVKSYSDDHQFRLTPGNFYYYAIFEGLGCYSSFVDTDGDGIGEAENPAEGVVIGFTLAGYGSLKNPGIDVYNLYGDYPARSLFTVNSPNDPDIYVGPDGRPDGVIIVVESGGDIRTPGGMEKYGD